jgi:hypothetical protein
MMPGARPGMPNLAQAYGTACVPRQVVAANIIRPDCVFVA